MYGWKNVKCWKLMNDWSKVLKCKVEWMNVKCWKLINVQCTCMGKLELMNEWLKNVAN